MQGNAYVQTPIYNPRSVYPSSGHSSKSLHEGTSGAQNTSVETIHLRPFHAAKVVDPRLADLNISTWTTVCDNNELMRNLLRRWLHCEYQFTAAFQIDLFLEDMINLRENYCLSLLVNIMLGYACVRFFSVMLIIPLTYYQVCYPELSDRAEYWNPHTLTYQFLAEAKRLWELDSHEPRITTIQAAMLFSVFYNLNGLDEVGQAYRLHAITLVHKMGLFKSNPGGARRNRLGRAYTAWAFFNWET